MHALDALRSTRVWPLLDRATSRSPATRSPLPRNALWLVRRLQPTATGHTLPVGVLQRRRQQEFLWEGPTRFHAPGLPAWSVPGRGAGSIPIDTRFATALAHTP